MIPFEYRTPKSLKEVHATLKEFGGDAKLLAGGTALVIMMKQRLVRPTCLVSLSSVRGLNGARSFSKRSGFPGSPASCSSVRNTGNGFSAGVPGSPGLKS